MHSKILLFLITSTVLKKLGYLTVVKRVSNESMLAAQEQVKSNPAYAVNGEVQVVHFNFILSLATYLYTCHTWNILCRLAHTKI